MQDVIFRDIDEFLDYLPDDELRLTEQLRKIIFDCVPDIKEKLSYNIPFYRLNKGLFFIWPASVLWGKKKTYTGVRFGFQQGYLLADELNYLDRGDRKQVYYREFISTRDVDVDLLKTYIYDAVMVDKQFKKVK